MLDFDESARLRSEGALDLARKVAPDLRRIAMGLNSERWREYLPELEVLGPSIPALRAARDRLDGLRERDCWPGNAAPMHALVALESGLYALESAVHLQLKGQSIDHGAQLLEDAVAQLIARARVTASPEEPRTEDFDAFRRAFALSGALSAATLFTMTLVVAGRELLSFFLLALLAMVFLWMASMKCARCARRLLGARLWKTLAEGRCGHCGHRRAAP